jgi:hypothetical protein
MKKVSQISAIVFLGVFVLLSMGNPVNAITYSSGFQVQNLSSAVANIQIKYIDQAGTVVNSTSTTVPANSSITKFPIDAPSPFNGSVIIESDQQVVAIVNTVGDGTYFASTTGFSSGSTSINLPLLMKGNSGFDTWFNVQNTGSASTDVTVTYSNATTETATIAPGAAKTFDQATNAALPAGFVGSAAVISTGSQPIVASVMQVGTGATKALLGYNSFGSGSTTITAPLVMANNSGFFTGIQVQNVGTAPTDVTITYGANTAGSLAPTADTCAALPVGQSCTRLQLGGQWTSTYVGGATVSNSAGQNLVAIVNQLSLVGQGTAYEGFDPAGASTSVVAPLVMANNSGFFTGIQVQNVGTGNCDIALAYGPNTAGSFAPAAETFTGLTPGSSNTFLQTGASWPDIYVGSATITGTGATCRVASIVNELAFGSGDQFMTYQALAAN